jgi:predicted component of type VI protein secretion system
MGHEVVVSHDIHPLLLDGRVASIEAAGLWQRQRAGLAIAADELAEGRMRGEIGAAPESVNSVRGYLWYLHATDAHPFAATAAAEVSDDEIIAAIVGHPPAGLSDHDAWSLYIDPVPALVAEIRRLLALVAELRTRE